MARPELPTDGMNPYGSMLRNAINDVSDRADAALANVGGGGGSIPYIVVASADAPESVKSTAAFVCTGSNDQIIINTAIQLAAALNSRNSSSPPVAQQRGTVLLSGGRFNCSGSIFMHTGVRLMGSGYLTEIRAVNCNQSGLIMLTGPSHHLCEVSNMWLNGNYSGGGSCSAIWFDMTNSGNTNSYPTTNPDSYHYIHDLYVQGFMGGTRNGIYLGAEGTANNRGNIVRDIQMRDIAQHGIWLVAASDSFVFSSHIGGCGGHGVFINTGNTKVVGVKTFYCNTTGFRFQSGRHIVSGLESQDDYVGYVLAAADATYTGLLADTSNADGIVIASGGQVVTGFTVMNRGSGRYSTTVNGVRIVSSPQDVTLIGRVKATSITNPYVGSLGARSFARVSNGSSLVAVG